MINEKLLKNIRDEIKEINDKRECLDMMLCQIETKIEDAIGDKVYSVELRYSDEVEVCLSEGNELDKTEIPTLEKYFQKRLYRAYEVMNRYNYTFY